MSHYRRYKLRSHAPHLSAMVIRESAVQRIMNAWYRRGRPILGIQKIQDLLTSHLKNVNSNVDIREE